MGKKVKPASKRASIVITPRVKLDACAEIISKELTKKAIKKKVSKNFRLLKDVSFG